MAENYEVTKQLLTTGRMEDGTLGEVWEYTIRALPSGQLSRVRVDPGQRTPDRVAALLSAEADVLNAIQAL